MRYMLYNIQPFLAWIWIWFTLYLYFCFIYASQHHQTWKYSSPKKKCSDSWTNIKDTFLCKICRVNISFANQETNTIELNKAWWMIIYVIVTQIHFYQVVLSTINTVGVTFKMRKNVGLLVSWFANQIFTWRIIAVVTTWYCNHTNRIFFSFAWFSFLSTMHFQ